MAKKPLEARFWEKVHKTDSCWKWTGATNGTYGCIYTHGERLNTYAHRVSYEIHNGEIPDGMLVMHSCDNPLCVNPDHLSVGTYKDNAQDMARKGRASTPLAKLTPAAVRRIFRKSINGHSKVSLAGDYGVNVATISNIMARRTWKHITAPLVGNGQEGV